MPKISVIIPAYNAARTIAETIDSVRQQTFKDLEIIVINDGSTDRTSEIAQNTGDRRIKVFDYPNGGISTARNRGITHAQGEYISFLDADDKWTLDKLEQQLAALESNPKASVAYSWIIVMLEKENDLEEVSLFSGSKVTFNGDIYAELLLQNFIGNGSNILAKREAIESIGEFDRNFQPCEDWDYYLRLAAKYNFALVPKHQVFYRKTPGTLSANGSIMEAAGLKVIDRAYRIAPKKLQKNKNKSIAKLSIVCGRIYFDRSRNSHDIAQVRQRLLKAIKLDPLILLSGDTCVLLAKVFLDRILQKKTINNLIIIIKKPFEIKRKYF